MIGKSRRHVLRLLRYSDISRTRCTCLRLEFAGTPHHKNLAAFFPLYRHPRFRSPAHKLSSHLLYPLFRHVLPVLPRFIGPQKLHGAHPARALGVCACYRSPYLQFLCEGPLQGLEFLCHKLKLACTEVLVLVLHLRRIASHLVFGVHTARAWVSARPGLTGTIFQNVCLFKDRPRTLRPPRDLFYRPRADQKLWGDGSPVRRSHACKDRHPRKIFKCREFHCDAWT